MPTQVEPAEWRSDTVSPDQTGTRLSSSAPPPETIASWRPQPDLPATERYGRFDILGRIGRGGMAEILLARERSATGATRHLVIKRILPEAADDDEVLHMFLDEARVVMGLSHPNLCQIYDVGEQGGTWFIAMEWVNGPNLSQIVRRGLFDHPNAPQFMARIMSQCAEALHYAHTARDGHGRPMQLVHRDVSPHNIMVAYDGRVKLLDFGIAKSAGSTHHTEAGVVKGKLCYMAPEQWRGEALDARTDVFALGVSLYEALTGRVIFKRDNQTDVMHAITCEGAPPVKVFAPGLDESLAAIVHRAMERDPEHRYQSAAAMRDALEAYIASTGEPMHNGRVADLMRGLFATEVQLGPILERPVRAAELASIPAAVDIPGPPQAPSLSVPIQGLGLPSPARSLQVPSTGSASPPPWSVKPARSILSRDPEASLPAPLFSNSPDSTLDETAAVDVPPFVMDSSQPPVGRWDSEKPTNPLQDRLLEPLALEAGDRGPVSEPTMDLDPALLELAQDIPQSAPVPRFDGGPSVHDPDTSKARAPAPTGALPGQRMKQALVAAACAVVAVALSIPLLTSDPAATPEAKVGASTPVQAPAPSTPPAAEPQPAAQAPVAPAPRGPAAPAAAEPAGAPGAETPQPAPKRRHYLSINTRPWSTVYLGNRRLGTTPIARARVPGRMLKLRLVDRDGNVHVRRVPRSRETRREVFFDLHD